MARTATARTHFVETKVDTTSNPGVRFVDYDVEVRQGQVRWTIGRVSGVTGRGGSTWNALPVGAQAWTRYHGTRRDALRALEAREDFRNSDTWTSTIPA